MTGVYTENQPDFTWLKPFEEKTFKQYFMPYKKVGAVKNASIHAALNVETTADSVSVIVYGTEKYKSAEIVVVNNGKEVCREQACISPVDIYEKVIATAVKKPQDIYVAVCAHGKVLVEYQPAEEKIPELGKPAEAAKEPEEIMTNEELLLTAQHIEQHRHATYLPDPYYLEGLKRDKEDSRINNAYGMLLLRRGNFTEAEKYFRTAIRRITWRSPNPYNSETYYNLGLTLFYQGKAEAAFDAFYKAAWSNEQQEMSYYYLAVIEAARQNYEESLQLIEKGLVKNSHNIKARGLKAIVLRKMGRTEQASEWISENLKIDSFDYVSWFEKAALSENKEEVLKELNGLMRNFRENYLQTARDYAEAGCYEEAVSVLEECTEDYPMLFYYKAYYLHKNGKEKDSKKECAHAKTCSPLYCFPNKLEDIFVLEYAIQSESKAAKAHYYLGNLYYDKLQFKKATKLWEKSVELDDSYPTVHRNLALAYYNKENAPEKARKELEKAFTLDEADTRVFLELDQLYKKLGGAFDERLKNYESHREILQDRDDVMLEFVTLYNLTGQYEKAYETIMGHSFRPWEGAEGRISGQYKIALTEMAKQKIKKNQYEEAEKLLEKALEYPINLGEGRRGKGVSEKGGVRRR